MIDDIYDLPDDHDCAEEGCVPPEHYGRSRLGLCLVCCGCGQPDCCGPCGDECFPKAKSK